MPAIRRFKVEKLIRDKLPAIMRAQGLSVFERVLAPAEASLHLRAKLLEEAGEAQAAQSDNDLLGELADVCEVVRALAAAHGFTMDDVERARLRKREDRGGFDARIYNAAVEAGDDCPAIAYYIARPEAYPEER